MKRPLAVLLVLALPVGSALILPLEVRTDYAFISDTTGSRYGYTQWFFGGRTHDWYQKSAIEEFIHAHYPSELQNRWKPYANTGRNILGRNIAFRCYQRPPLLLLPPEILSTYWTQTSDEEKLGTYRALVAANRAEAEQIADAILAKAAGAPVRRPEPATSTTNLFE